MQSRIVDSSMQSVLKVESIEFNNEEAYINRPKVILLIIKPNSSETMYQREKALYEQKIQFLELHLHEAREREENLKKMNENIMAAFNDLSSGRTNMAV